MAHIAADPPTARLALAAGEPAPPPPPPRVQDGDRVRFEQALAAGASTSGKAAANAAIDGAAPAARTTATAAADGIPAATAGTVRVTSGAELAKALADAVPGQHIVLAKGTYSAPGGFELRAAGRPDAPIVIKAETPLGATLVSDLRLGGADQVAQGLVVRGATVELAGDRTRLTRSRVEDTPNGDIAILVRSGHDVRVDHNELAGVAGRGISIKPDPAHPDALLRPRIDHNWLHDWVGKEGENVHEGIQIGQTRTHSDIAVGAIVEYNLFERVGIDHEAISIKSSDNVVRYNTLLDSPANICNRHGQGNAIVGNWMEGCRGIIVFDSDTLVAGNRVTESGGHGIRVMAGTHESDVNAVGYPAASGTRLVGNEVDRVVIGDAFSGGSFGASRVQVTGVYVEGDQGARLIVTAMAEDVRTLDGSAAAPSDFRAVRLSAADVGTGAPAGTTAASGDAWPRGDAFPAIGPGRGRTLGDEILAGLARGGDGGAYADTGVRVGGPGAPRVSDRTGTDRAAEDRAAADFAVDPGGLAALIVANLAPFMRSMLELERQ